MPRLLSPGVGDLTDRHTILALKITMGARTGRPVDHFLDEQRQIERCSAWKQRFLPMTKRQRQAYEQEHETLATLNTSLWEYTDQLREYNQLTGKGLTPTQTSEVAGLALLILRANDKRAACVARIDQLAGTYAGAEKL